MPRHGEDGLPSWWTFASRGAGLFLSLWASAAGMAHAAPFAYIPNFGSANVSVIDTAINAVVATVPVGSSPHGAAVSPDGTRVYVSNGGGATVSVLDTSSCGAGATGSFDGFFTGRTGQRAGMMYNLGGVQGAVAFGRRGG